MVVVSDRDEARAQAFAQKHGIPRWITSMKEAINDPEAEHVVIGLPNNFNIEAVRLADGFYHGTGWCIICSPEIVEEINPYGGKLGNTAGVSEDQLRRAASSAVCKINIYSDGRLAVTAANRKVFYEKPGEFDPRNYLGPARDKIKELYRHKIINVLCSAGKA